METTSSSPSPEHHDFICPITLDVYRDPVLAGDGHVYERIAIVQWIEKHATSPLTREPLNVNDLRSEENIKQLCQSNRSNSVIYSCQTNMISLPSSSIVQSNVGSERRTLWKQRCNSKRALLIIMATSLIVSPFIIASSIIICFHPSNSVPSIVSTTITYPKDYIQPSISYKLPNNCTLPQIVLLFSWNNVQAFNYTYYSTLYTAVSTRTIITFAFQYDQSYWCLDDVSVIDISSKTELVTNRNFENNPSDGFLRCNSYGDSSTTLFLAASHTHNDTCSFYNGTVDLPDYLSQTLNTKIGQVYQISFWLQNNGDAPNSTQIVMSY